MSVLVCTFQIVVSGLFIQSGPVVVKLGLQLL